MGPNLTSLVESGSCEFSDQISGHFFKSEKKNPGFVLFRDNMTHFGPQYDTAGFEQGEGCVGI